MRTGISLCLFSICLFATSIAVALDSFEHIKVFGDSLSDVGNNAWYLSQSPTETIIGAPITNRDDNGQRRIWIQYFEKKAGIGGNQLLPARGYFDNPSAVNQNNLDYAVAGAISADGYFNDNGIPTADCHMPGKFGTKICIPGLLKQVKLYLENAKKDPASFKTASQHTLYIFWVGGNDIFNSLIIPGSTAALQATQYIGQAVELLDNAGVPSDHIVVLNMLDLARTPAAAYVNQQNPGVLPVIHFVCSKFNAKLATTMTSIENKNR